MTTQQTLVAIKQMVLKIISHDGMHSLKDSIQKYEGKNGVLLSGRANAINVAYA